MQIQPPTASRSLLKIEFQKLVIELFALAVRQIIAARTILGPDHCADGRLFHLRFLAFHRCQFRTFSLTRQHPEHSKMLEWSGVGLSRRNWMKADLLADKAGGARHSLGMARQLLLQYPGAIISSDESPKTWASNPAWNLSENPP